MSIEAIASVAAVSAQPVSSIAASSAAIPTENTSFADFLAKGVAAADAKLAEADRLVAQFAVDDSLPVHRVTYALEEARLSFELMLQVRNRLLEGAQQLMNMQL